MQRDTIVRRWLVVSPESPAAAALGRVLPEVRLTRATLDTAAAELARLGGMPIRVDPGVYAAGRGNEPRPIDLVLRNVTLAEALAAVLAAEEEAAVGAEDAPIAVPRGGEVVILAPADARRHLAVRAYGMDNLLPPDGPPRTIAADRFAQMVQPAPMSDRQQLADGLAEMVHNDLTGQPGLPWREPISGKGGGWPWGAIARPFGGRLIVAAPAVDQHRAPQLLDALQSGGRLRPGTVERSARE